LEKWVCDEKLLRLELERLLVSGAGSTRRGRLAAKAPLAPKARCRKLRRAASTLRGQGSRSKELGRSSF